MRSAKRYKEVDIPVIAGAAHLPDGRVVESTAQVVRVPVLTGDRLYERIERFRAMVPLPGAVDVPEEDAMRAVIAKLDRPLRGPRGGRYIPFGPTVFGGIGETADDFMRNTRTATGWRMARYVRPDAK